MGVSLVTLGAAQRRSALRAQPRSFAALTTMLAFSAALAGCNSSGAIERVPIPPRSTIRAAADSLAAHGIIKSPTWFRLRARFSGGNRTVKAGVYLIARGTSTATVLRRLRDGDAERFRVTLPVGGTIFDLAHNVEATLFIPADSVVSAARDSAAMHGLNVPGTTAEGWLLPESFDFGGFDNARDVIARFVAGRLQTWDTAWDRRGAAQQLDRESLLVLASIVEAEAKDPAERPLIAAVYRNRIRLGMPLQADPTIEYGYLLRDGQRKGRLFNKDYQFQSPWNTYLHTGLPPGPIGNPSREAIEAVLSPAKVPYLYFVAGPDGKSLFATTVSEHLRNIQRVRRLP